MANTCNFYTFYACPNSRCIYLQWRPHFLSLRLSTPSWLCLGRNCVCVACCSVHQKPSQNRLSKADNRRQELTVQCPKIYTVEERKETFCWCSLACKSLLHSLLVSSRLLHAPTICPGKSDFPLFINYPFLQKKSIFGYNAFWRRISLIKAVNVLQSVVCLSN